MCQDSSAHRGSLDKRRSHRYRCVVFLDKENLLKAKRLALGELKVIDLDDISRSNTILLAACFNNCVHEQSVPFPLGFFR